MVASRLVGCCGLLSFAAAFGQGYVLWNDESDYTTQVRADRPKQHPLSSPLSLFLSAIVGCGGRGGWEALVHPSIRILPPSHLSHHPPQTIAGSSIGTDDGAGTDARFRSPVALALDEVYRVLYVADRVNHRRASRPFEKGLLVSSVSSCMYRARGAVSGFALEVDL